MCNILNHEITRKYNQKYFPSISTRVYALTRSWCVCEFRKNVVQLTILGGTPVHHSTCYQMNISPWIFPLTSVPMNKLPHFPKWPLFYVNTLAFLVFELLYEYISVTLRSEIFQFSHFSRCIVISKKSLIFFTSERSFIIGFKFSNFSPAMFDLKFSGITFRRFNFYEISRYKFKQ